MMQWSNSTKLSFPAKCFCSCLGTENSQMVPNQETMEGDQPVQSHGHAQEPFQPQIRVHLSLSPGETGLKFVSFPGHFEISIVGLLFIKVLNYLSS